MRHHGHHLRDTLGICQWFHYQAYDDVQRCVELMHELGVRHLRTGISWADFHRPEGKAWYDWQMNALADFDILLSIWHTPPSIAEGGVCAGPPRRLRDYADFIGQIIDEYGDSFTHLELWNEPNNRYKWDFRTFDPQWKKFAQMIAMAARTARMHHVPTVLGGMIPVDPHWLELIQSHGGLDDIDIIAIHAFPGMWWDGDICWEWKGCWNGWADKVNTIAPHTRGRPVWCTETGLATVNHETCELDRHDEQVQRLDDAARAPVDRTYWYCLVDLDPHREAIEGYHVDENEYHMGLVTYEGEKKPAWHRMKQLLNTPHAPHTPRTPHAPATPEPAAGRR